MEKFFNLALHTALGPMRQMNVRFALVKYGGGIIQMSGSIGGQTYARNRFGNYVRARTKPINPNTARQQGVRAAMAYLTTRWADTLTIVQRTAWNLYGTNVAMKNRLAETVYLTGFNHYIRSNLINKQLALSIIDDGPTTFEVPAKDPTMLFTASMATQQISVVYDDTMDWANETGGYLHLFQGMPQNSQRNFFAGPWRFIGSIVGVTGTPPSSPEVVGVNFAIAELQKCWIYGRIGRADGRLSQKFRDDVIISS